MKIFGLDIARAVTVEKQMQPVSSFGQGFWGLIREPFSGAWQRNMEIEGPKNLLAFSAVFACVSIIAHDISKLRIKLVERSSSGTWDEVEREDGKGSAFLPVLRQPNAYQNRIQFLMMWLTSKLLYGNTYVLKERDNRRVVTRLHVLDANRVVPLVTETGDVYYQLKRDDLAEVRIDDTVPASEIIHDRYLTLWHPLVGVSPIYACGASGTQGIRIQANSEIFFKNLSRPSGMLSYPGKISTDTAARIKDTFEHNFSGGNLGRFFVSADGPKYESMTMPAVDAQLIEQLKWTVEDVARCFRVPLHKLAAGQNPTYNNAGAFNQDYYSQTLQHLIESIELLLDEGLNLPPQYGTELDTDSIQRLDPLSRAEWNEKRLRAGYLTTNEARLTDNLPRVDGGDVPFMQHQMYPIDVLADRTLDVPAPVPAIAPPPAEPAAETDEEEAEEEAKELQGRFGYGLKSLELEFT